MIERGSEIATKQLIALATNKEIKDAPPKSDTKNIFNATFKCSSFYDYVQMDYECFNYLFTVKKGDYNVPNKHTSIKEYMEHCYLNRKFKRLSKIDNNETIYKYFGNIRENNPRYKFRWEVLNNKSFKFFIDELTLCKVSRITPNIIDSMEHSFDSINDPVIKIEFFGANAIKHKMKLIRMYKRMSILEDKNRDNLAYIQSMVGGVGREHEDDYYIELKTFDQIFIEKEKKTKIVTCVENMLKMNNIQSAFGLSPKFGILLYGKPGTGKTSIIKAIIDKVLDRTSSTSMTAFRIKTIDVSCSLDSFRSIINKYKRTGNEGSRMMQIYIIEEIDAIMNKSRDDDTSEANAKIKLLLEFIDGFSTPNGSVMLFLASTNYYERLDHALKRDGRFDLRIELNDLGKEESGEMLDHFKVSRDIRIFDGDKNWAELERSFTINPAELQNRILRYLASKEENK